MNSPEDEILGIGNARIIKQMQDERHDDNCRVPRSQKPHMAILTFKIDIRGYNADETLDLYSLGDKDLQKYGMTSKAQIIVKGSNEANCIKKVKNLLENLNVDARQ